METKPKILVTGATGKTGTAVIDQLVKHGWPVRAIVRSIDRRSGRLEALGVETVMTDIFDPEQLLKAMDGVQRAYYCSFIDPYMIQSVAAFAVAAQAARLEAIVSLGQWLSSPNHPSLQTRHNWHMEETFSAIPGIAHVRVNPGWFADNNLRLIAFAVHLGIFPILTGQSKNAPPATEDIARVAVAALMDPARHTGRTYRPTGPELLSGDDIVRILSEVLHRKVRRVDLPWWMFERAARMQKVSPFQILSVRHYVRDHREGAFALSAPTNHVLEVTGEPAESFATTVLRYAALPENQDTTRNRVKTLFDFLRNPMSPGYDLAKVERQIGAPAPPNPQYAMENPTWLASHGAQFMSAQAQPLAQQVAGLLDSAPLHQRFS